MISNIQETGMFPCKQKPLSEKGKQEFDRIFGHGEYDKSKHGDTWNEALKVCVEKEVENGNRKTS